MNTQTITGYLQHSLKHSVFLPLRQWEAEESDNYRHQAPFVHMYYWLIYLCVYVHIPLLYDTPPDRTVSALKPSPSVVIGVKMNPSFTPDRIAALDEICGENYDSCWKLIVSVAATWTQKQATAATVTMAQSLQHHRPLSLIRQERHKSSRSM